MMLHLVFALLLNPVQRALSESVIVRADYRDDQHRLVRNDDICSGVVIARTQDVYTIATARHCTYDDRLTNIQFYDGDSASVLGYSISKKADVAVVYALPKRDHPCAPLSSQVNLGQPFFLVGDSSGDHWSYSQLYSRNGSEIVYDKGDALLAFEGPSVFNGDSGSGIFDNDGNVVGILDAGSDPGRPAVVYAAPISYVTNLIEGRP